MPVTVRFSGPTGQAGIGIYIEYSESRYNGMSLTQKLGKRGRFSKVSWSKYE